MVSLQFAPLQTDNSKTSINLKRWGGIYWGKEHSEKHITIDGIFRDIMIAGLVKFSKEVI